MGKGYALKRRSGNVVLNSISNATRGLLFFPTQPLKQLVDATKFHRICGRFRFTMYATILFSDLVTETSKRSNVMSSRDKIVFLITVEVHTVRIETTRILA